MLDLQTARTMGSVEPVQTSRKRRQPTNSSASKQAVVKIVKTAELTYSRSCMQADQAPSASCYCKTGSQSIPYQRGEVMISCTCMRCRACGCSSSTSPSTGVRPRPNRGGKEAGVGFCGWWLLSTTRVAPNMLLFRQRSSHAVSRCIRLARALSVRAW